ncbi:hypothetical protein DMB92_01990 [Campylobacter sp. MIT 99-7217]|uniref:LPS assembly lipoprotein LptE n=1 Tax=Campylobacter sp. MIT 99-7217 TaxID=535091 RepID=UPI001159D038|nr:LPS assembly lipoprotein LptE [Campylobacter sp. MIT 99-7217]TQR33680.1 hypothetical protein DMB92_01990 [Campylobacter sp. MIT 99-7217]
MKIVILSFLLFYIGACGYAPTSKISSNVFNDKIYVEVIINQQDPQNSIFVVDTLREVVLNKLGKTPALKSEADDTIRVEMNNLSFTPIIYDENGYVIGYKAKLELEFYVSFKDKQDESIKTTGSYDFAISPNSVISDTARLEAIRTASSEAFDEFISVLAIKGQQNVKY